MKKKKRALLFLALGFVAWCVNKWVEVYKPRLDWAAKIEKELSEHLEAKYGKEHRKVGCFIIFSSMSMTFHYPAAFLATNPGMQEECWRYINENYPEMASFVKKITFKPIAE